MNLVDLQNKLLAAARHNAPDDRVPYAFEKRITALLIARHAAENMNLWVRGFWRAAVSCMAITLLLGAWATFHPTAKTVAYDDLAENFETTLLASVDQNDLVQ